MRSTRREGREEGREMGKEGVDKKISSWIGVEEIKSRRRNKPLVNHSQ